ncbi:MAG: tetratricopeptide repeat protein [Planctomycetota bacterium]|jgi:hypothetical protein
MKIVLTLGLFLALSTTGYAQRIDDDDPADDRTVRTSLSRIRLAADAYRNVWVSFPVQFVSMGSVKNPFFTRFVPAKYANFYAWPAEQQIWRRDKYEDPFPLLFLSKRSDQLERLYKMKLYQQMQVTGVVRNVFQGEPWIEIVWFDELDPKVNTSVLSHLYRGEQFMKKREWSKAISEFSLAPASNVPDNVVAHVHKSLAVCYLRLGEPDTAISHLNVALSMVEEPDAEARRLADVAVRTPESELDRTVTGAQIADHERPMWEAFEEMELMR